MQKIIEATIFKSKWLLIPFYLVLILSLIVYTYFDVAEFIHYVRHLTEINKQTAMLTFIELIDMTMIANLGSMIIVGSYNSFVNREHPYEGKEISSNMLKVKMATSLVGITSIALLQKASVDIAKVPWDELLKLGFVHGVFLCSSIIVQIIDYMYCKSHEEAKIYHCNANTNP